MFFGSEDAAGKGFMSTVARSYDCQSKSSKVISYDNGLNCQVGIWTALEELESSNYKEFYDLMETTEEECKSGCLHNYYFFVHGQLNLLKLLLLR